MTSITSIYSPLPGNGVTTIAANLAALLASWGSRVCLVDLNFDFPDVAEITGLPQEQIQFTLTDCLFGKCEAVSTLIQLPAERFGGGEGQFWVVPASKDLGDRMRLHREGYDFNLLNKAIKSACQKTQADHLILDLSAGMRDDTMLTIGISDTLLTVASPKERTLRELASVLRTADMLEISRSFTILNKIPANYDREQVRGEVEKKLEVKIAAAILQSGDIETVGDSGRFFALAFPYHPFSRELASCAALL